MKHKLPDSVPSEWLASVAQPDVDGCYRGWIVLHEVDGAMPFVVHQAFWNDDLCVWSYAQGDYCATKAEALERFKKRAF